MGMGHCRGWTGALVLIMAFALGGCSDGDSNPGIADEDEPEIWRFALEEIGGSLQEVYAQRFKERLEDLSDGRVKIEIYPYGSIGSSPHLTELVRDGRVDLAFASAGHLAPLIPETGVFLLHFVLADDSAINKQVLSSKRLHTLFEGPYARQNLTLLDIIPKGWMVWTGNRPLRHPDDFRDFRIRTMAAPMQIATYQAYGAVPVPMPFSDVYEALQRKRIDGQVSPVFAIQEMQFHDVQTHLTLARPTQFIATIIASRDWHGNLSAQHQQWLEQARHDLVDFIHQQQNAFNADRLEQIREGGNTTIVTLSAAERELFRQVSHGVRDTYLTQTGEQGRKILSTLEQLIREASDQP